MTGPLRDARTGSLEDLEALLQSTRRALERLGERIPPNWTADAVDDLRRGRLTGRYRPIGPDGGEIGFYSRRGDRAYGHLHVLPGPAPARRAETLADALASAPDLAGSGVRIGLTGLDPAEEASLLHEWSERPGRSFLRRWGLERPVDDASPPEPPGLPEGFARVPVRAVTETALADLDLRGFRASPDAALFSGVLDEYTRMVSGILDGRLGRFLDEASEALLSPEGGLAGFLLTVELTPSVGLLADLVVDPGRRRQGIGRRLVLRGLRALRALGYSTAQLWVTEGNFPARTLYDRLGFRAVATSVILLQDPGAAPGQPHESA